MDPNPNINRVVSPKAIEFTIRFYRFHVLVDRLERVVLVFTLAVASIDLFATSSSPLLDY